VSQVADDSFSLLFNTLVALTELTDAFSSRPILLKHKAFTFYRPAAYALAQLAADVPVVFIQVTCFDLIIYFMTNMARTPAQFFINFFVLYITTMTMYAFFRMLGALCSSLDIATRVSGISIQVLIVYAGYVIPKPSMHPWFVWVLSTTYGTNASSGILIRSAWVFTFLTVELHTDLKL
jgi:ABC-type multidrug transport system permease subunit